MRREAIAGLAVTTQRATMVCTDGKGRPLRPAIVWLDQRRTEGVPPVGGLWGMLFRLSGMSETVGYFQAEAEAHWLARNEPETWKKAERYLFLSGFLAAPAHGAVRRFVGRAGRLRPVRLPAPPLGRAAATGSGTRSRSVASSCRSSCRRAGGSAS